jgi:hypothetical protein
MHEDADELRRVEETLERIESNTRTTWRELLLAGLLRGVGVVIGGALTVALAGWGLTALGFIPGAEEIAGFLAQIFSDASDGSLPD